MIESMYSVTQRIDRSVQNIFSQHDATNRQWFSKSCSHSLYHDAVRPTLLSQPLVIQLIMQWKVAYIGHGSIDWSASIQSVRLNTYRSVNHAVAQWLPSVMEQSLVKSWTIQSVVQDFVDKSVSQSHGSVLHSVDHPFREVQTVASQWLHAQSASAYVKLIIIAGFLRAKSDVYYEVCRSGVLWKSQPLGVL